MRRVHSEISETRASEDDVHRALEILGARTLNVDGIHAVELGMWELGVGEKHAQVGIAAARRPMHAVHRRIRIHESVECARPPGPG